MLPDGGLQVTTGVGSTSSVAETTYVTVAPAGLVPSTTIVAGRRSAGGVTSSRAGTNSAAALPIDPAMIRDAARLYLKNDNIVKVTLFPEKPVAPEMLELTGSLVSR